MIHDDLDKCPKCGCEEIHRDSVDNGFGIQYGPYGCPECLWSQDSEYDLSEGQSAFDEKGGMIDQYGSYYPPGNMVARACFKGWKNDMEATGKPLKFRKSL